jgi:hypothetical protein
MRQGGRNGNNYNQQRPSDDVEDGNRSSII